MRRFVRRRRLVAAAALALAPLLATAAVAAPGKASAKVPGFTQYPVPSSFGEADFSGEPSIGIDWRTNVVLFMANIDTYKFSLQSGTWSDVSSGDSNYNDDPILATDSQTGLTLAGGDNEACSIMSASTDDGAHWSLSLPCTVTIDHPTVGVGPAYGASPQSGKQVVYFCQQYPVLDQCTTSTDNGNSWLPSHTITDGCAGITGHVKIAPNGTAYLPIRECAASGGSLGGAPDYVGGAISTDNGRDWKSYWIPNQPSASRGFDPSIAVTPDNGAWEAFERNTDYRPMAARTSNLGKTWTTPVDIAKGAPYPIYATAFQAAVAGDVNRIAVAYLGADRPGTADITPFDSGYVGYWYLYLSESLDGGKHWTTTRVRPQPLQYGPLCDAGITCSTGRNLLDFMDAGVTQDGRIVIGYADGCPRGCPATPETSTHQYGTLAVQTSGPRLFAHG